MSEWKWNLKYEKDGEMESERPEYCFAEAERTSGYVGDYYYYSGHALHAVERMTNPLVMCNSQFAGLACRRIQ